MSTALSNEVVTDTEEQAKPPFLRRVRIRGYKSIAFCDVSWQPLTILVGRNGSGKSNFLDALAFLRERSSSTSRRPSTPRRVSGHPLPFGVVVSRIHQVEVAFSESRPGAYSARYGITFPADQTSAPPSPQEGFRFTDVTRNRTARFQAREREGGMVGQWPVRHLFPSEFLYLGVLGERPFHSLADGLRDMGFYHFHPEAIRRLQKPKGSATSRTRRQQPRRRHPDVARKAPRQFQNVIGLSIRSSLRTFRTSGHPLWGIRNGPVPGAFR